jgi:hypothetical protein
MPFRCKICDLDILAGTPMVSNERDELAHEACVPKSVHLPSIKLVGSSPPLPAPQPSLPSPMSPDLCIPSVRPSVCSECGDSCISECPICRRQVCQAYGWNGRNCSILHETKCPDARLLREPPLKAPKPLVTIEICVPWNGNGKHRAVKPKKRGSR